MNAHRHVTQLVALTALSPLLMKKAQLKSFAKGFASSYRVGFAWILLNVVNISTSLCALYVKPINYILMINPIHNHSYVVI